jgi:hypothetical protein
MCLAKSFRALKLSCFGLLRRRRFGIFGLISRWAGSSLTAGGFDGFESSLGVVDWAPFSSRFKVRSFFLSEPVGWAFFFKSRWMVLVPMHSGNKGGNELTTSHASAQLQQGLQLNRQAEARNYAHSISPEVLSTSAQAVLVRVVMRCTQQRVEQQGS